MNTFALILLAFPFYLAVKGRLTTYTDLAAKKVSAPTSQDVAGTMGLVQPVTPIT